MAERDLDFYASLGVADSGGFNQGGRPAHARERDLKDCAIINNSSAAVSFRCLKLLILYLM
jgi:hypothetical protein